MATPFISTSDITFVDFRQKKVIAQQILKFEKTELLNEGLINYERLIKRGHMTLVSENYGSSTYFKAS
jgi:hypothetical protein